MMDFLIKKLPDHLPTIIILIFVIIFAFWDLPHSFFEQDEWHSIGNYLYLSTFTGFDFIKKIFENGSLIHFTPLSLLFKMTLYQQFSLGTTYYFIASITLHLLVAISVYFLIYLLVRNKIAALLGSLFFAVNSSHYQAVTWLGTFEGIEWSTLLGNAALITCLLTASGKQKGFLFLSLLLVFLSLLFKETGLSFLIILAGLVIVKLSGRLRTTGLLGLLLLGIIYSFLRLNYLLWSKEMTSLATSTNITHSVPMIVYNFISQSFNFFSQIILPYNLLVIISSQALSFYNQRILVKYLPWRWDETFFYELISVGIGLLLFLLITGLLKKDKNRFNIFLGLAFVWSSIITLLPLPRYLTYTDSRYLYQSSIGIALLLSLILKEYLHSPIQINKRTFAICIITTVILFSHLLTLRNIISQKVEEGNMRKNILNNILYTYPTLPARVVFYNESDRSYYGLPEDQLIMPFQSGFGQMLLVLYSSKVKFPRDFYQNNFLWEITDQGYKEIENRGFGYYRDFELMAKDIKEYHLSPEVIIAFSYDSQQHQLNNITKEVRGRMEGYLVNKKEINLDKSEVSASHNPEQAFLAIDQNKTTFWDSHLTYNQPQFFLLDLKQEKKIAQIRIDSSNNKDQNKVGYEIVLSKDQKNWQKVFYSKKYPPDKDGITNIYFTPTLTRYVKINQIGSHHYASWVINELKVFEVVDE